MIRTGDTIHSPKNCLPGAGWDPIHSGYAQVSVLGGRQIVVNEYVIQQDLNKQLVFYWYQGRGRVIASASWDVIDPEDRVTGQSGPDPVVWHATDRQPELDRFERLDR